MRGRNKRKDRKRLERPPTQERQPIRLVTAVKRLAAMLTAQSQGGRDDKR